MKVFIKTIYLIALILNISCSENIKISMAQSIAFKHPVTHISTLEKQIAYVVNNEIYIATLNKNNLLDENKSGMPKNAICLTNKVIGEFGEAKFTRRINTINLIPGQLLIVSFKDDKRIFCLDFKKSKTYIIDFKQNIITLNIMSDYKVAAILNGTIIAFASESFPEPKKPQGLAIKIDEKRGFHHIHTFENKKIVASCHNQFVIYDIVARKHEFHKTNGIKSAHFLNENEVLILKEKNFLEVFNITEQRSKYIFKPNIDSEITAINILSKSLISLTLESKELCLLNKTSTYNTKQKLNLKTHSPISENSFAAICGDELCIFKKIII